MSSALWHFFWDEGEWTGSPAPTPSPSPTPAPGPTQPPAPLPDPPDGNNGGGKGWGKGGKKREYVPNPVDLWEARENYLREMHPPEITPAPRPAEEYEAEANREAEARKQEIEQLTAERAAAISALRSSADIAAMKSQGAKIKELNAKIATLTNKQAVARFMK